MISTNGLMTKIRQFRFIMGFMLLLAVSGCQTDGVQRPDHLVFRYNESGNISSLDPAFARNPQNIWPTNQLFNGLVQLDDSLNIRPDIARDWSYNDSTSQVFTLTAVFAAICWKVFSVNPLAAVSGGIVLMLGTMAILITKGTELWVVPLAAQDLAAGSSGQEPGITLLSINSQSYPYSLTTYFDYLGLWLWSLFGLLVARPLFRFSTSAKVAAISLGLFGIIYPVFYGFVVTGAIPQEEIINYSTFMLLAWVGAFAIGIYCRGESKNDASMT